MGFYFFIPSQIVHPLELNKIKNRFRLLIIRQAECGFYELLSQFFWDFTILNSEYTRPVHHLIGYDRSGLTLFPLLPSAPLLLPPAQCSLH